MEMIRRPAKEVLIPISDSVDISRVRPIIDHPIFQKLRYRMQLGEAHIVYPDARHPRLSHSLGVGKWTWRRLRRWREWELIDDQDVVDGETFGFVHDIGHGPRSHITDALVSQDHETRAIALLQELRPEITKSGANPDRIVAMMRREDPLSVAVLHNPLGTDKLDYLARDAHHTGLEGMPKVGVYFNHIYYLNNELIVDAKIFSQVKLIMQFYRTMYARVYFRTAVLLSERYMQRMISTLLGQNGHDPAFSEAELVEMTDSDLDYHLSHATIPLVREQYDRYMRRHQPMPAIVYQMEPYYEHNWGGGHPVSHIEAPEALFNSKKIRRANILYTLERRIEQEFRLPDHSILAIAPVPARRFEPQNLQFLTDSGIQSLQHISPEDWDAQVSEAKRYACFYIATPKELCKQVSQPEVAKRIRELIISML
jgi:HD superfamily phosphohydrolase